MPSAFVTGGSGFIGGALIRRLTADGWTVRALARSEAAAGKVRANGGTAVTGDLDDPSSIRAGAQDNESWIGGGRHRTSTTHVDNVVEGLVLGALRGAPSGDITRARTELGYRPVRTIEDGMRELAEDSGETSKRETEVAA